MNRGLERTLIAKYKDSFAGLYIQHESEFKIILQSKNDVYIDAFQYTSDSNWKNIIEHRGTDFSLLELEQAQLLHNSIFRSLNITFESGINQFSNRVEVYVLNRNEFNKTLAVAGVSLPDILTVIQVEELSSSEVDIYGGLGLRTCTSGFSVKNTSNEKGVVTAAHCNNTQSYNNTNLPFGSERFNGSYDVQWHKAPNFTVKNWIKDGITTRTIVGVRASFDQRPNEYVCKYGISTGNTCGNIIDLNFTPTGPPNATNTYIRVRKNGVNLSEGGDSGGPWYQSSIAYGVHHAGIGDDAVYMPANYIGGLGLTILTSP